MRRILRADGAGLAGAGSDQRQPDPGHDDREPPQPVGAGDLGYAFRLFMLPQGLFSVAVSTVLFPELSRARRRSATWSSWRGSWPAARARSCSCCCRPRPSRSCWPSRSCGCCTSTASSTQSDTVRVSAALVMFSLGLLGNGLSLLLTRAFFRLQEPRVPTLVALVNLVLNLFLDLALLRYGAAGIALSTAVVTVVQRGRAGGAAASPGGLAARPRGAARRRVDRGGDDLLHGRGVRGLVPAGQAAGPLDRRSDRLARPGAGRRRIRLPGRRPARCIWPRWRPRQPPASPPRSPHR